MDLDSMRREYLHGGLSRSQLDDNPFEQFRLWFSQAVEVEMRDATAMILATVDDSGQPRQRTVLLKHMDGDGLVFFSNYGSAKALDMQQRPAVSLHFPWHLLDRQVIVQGVAEKIDENESEIYFQSRPRESQIAAWASYQSQPVSSRRELEAQFDSFKQRFRDAPIPKPDFWGGYRVRPYRFEFWQGRASRLHDRFEYRLSAEQNWEINRLSP